MIYIRLFSNEGVAAVILQLASDDRATLVVNPDKMPILSGLNYAFLIGDYSVTDLVVSNPVLSRYSDSCSSDIELGVFNMNEEIDVSVIDSLVKNKFGVNLPAAVTATLKNYAELSPAEDFYDAFATALDDGTLKYYQLAPFIREDVELVFSQLDREKYSSAFQIFIDFMKNLTKNEYEVPHCGALSSDLTQLQDDLSVIIDDSSASYVIKTFLVNFINYMVRLT